MGFFDDIKEAFMEGFNEGLNEGKSEEKNNNDFAVVKSDQKWTILGTRKNVIELLENICTIVDKQEINKYNLNVSGYNEMQARMYPSVTQLARISINPGQFVSLNDRFDGIEIQEYFSLLEATFDQEVGSEEWSRGEITFPIYEILNKTGNENFNVMAPYEKLIGRWQNIIFQNIENDDNITICNRRTSMSLVGISSSLDDFLFNDIIQGVIIPSYKEATYRNLSNEKDVFALCTYFPTINHTLVENMVNDKRNISNKYGTIFINFDKNNEINRLNRIFFDFNVMTLAFNEDGEIIDITEGILGLSNDISNELMKYF